MNADDEAVASGCACCGKGGDGLKVCTACKAVKYCNRACQLAHRRSHREECKERAAELLDEALFAQPSVEQNDCPICCLPYQPFLPESATYQPCCGQVLCTGCLYQDAVKRAAATMILPPCPFCRAPPCSKKGGTIDRLKKRTEANDAEAFGNLAGIYNRGDYGIPQDFDKAFALYVRGAELGSMNCHYSISEAYYLGEGAEKSMKKAVHHCQIAAMGGHVVARHNLGVFEANSGNNKRAVKHWMISAKAGYKPSLDLIQKYFGDGYATKDEFEVVLRAYQNSHNEAKSEERSKAMAGLSRWNAQFR